MTTDLEARLARLEAEHAIAKRLYAYGHAIDYGHEADWVDCFTDDGVWDVRMRRQSRPDILVQGRAELTAYIKTHTRAPARYHKHMLIEPLITVDGDSATAASYFIRVDAEDEGATRIQSMGRYRDQLQLGPDGVWRIKRRDVEVEDL